MAEAGSSRSGPPGEPPEQNGPSNSWEVEARWLWSEKRDWSPARCREAVIVEHLQRGDTRPLAAWLASGHRPSPGLCLHLARMLQPAAGTEAEIPFELVTSSRQRSGGRRPDFDKETLDKVLANKVHHRIGQGITREAAVVEVANELGGENTVSRVDKAYQTHYGGKQAASKKASRHH